MLIKHFGVTKNDAYLAKAKITIATIRSSIMLEKSKDILLGSSSYPIELDGVISTQINTSQTLFSNILKYPIYSIPNNQPKEGHWSKNSNLNYNYWYSNTQNIEFIYDNSDGSFDCNHKIDLCKKLAQ